MKERHQKKEKEYHSQNQSSENSMNCTCQILLDTSLSGVSNTECSCSDCLEANLNAFNELKEQVQHQEIKNNTLRRNMSAQHRKITNSQQKPNLNIDQNRNHRQNKSQNKFNFENKTTINNLKMKESKVSPNKNRNFQSKDSKFFEIQGSSIDPYTKQGFEDYIKITKHRTRKYIEQRKKLQAEQKEQKQKLKQKIKQNLEMLKYTANIIKDNQQNEGDQNQWNPKFVWNHEPYECQCNGKKGNKHKKNECCHFKQKKCPPKPLNTNLQKLIGPEFSQNRDQILKNKKKSRIEEIDAKIHEKCSDKCPKHHMRTSPSKIKKIEKFIQKRVKKIEEQKRKEKQKEAQQLKIKEAKLRAIDLKSKDLLSKSKKVDLAVSRTSFQLSIDHFSTFSDLRQYNQIRLQEKAKKKKVDQMMNQKGGAFEKAIYQNLDEDLEGDYFQEDKMNIQAYKIQNEQQDANFCQKIVKEAKIRPPKNIKEDDDKKKAKNKEKKPQSANLKEKSTIRKGMDLQKEEKRKRQLQQQIQRKKKELVHEYHKRNTNLEKQDPKNKEIRQNYEKKVNNSKNIKKTNLKTQEQPKNPYRNTYTHQPGKDKNQINIHGDPLFEQYQYHSKIKEKAVYQHGKKEDLFTKNYNALTQKQKLYS